MSLPLLPNELQDLIIENLHPTAAIALSQTNHYYHSVISLKRLNPDVVRQFLRDLEQLRRNRISPFKKLACYRCLCLKRYWHFTLAQCPYSTINEHPEKWQKRQCVNCDVADGDLKPGDIYTHDDGSNFLACSECLNPRKRFCAQCRCCARCLEKRAILCCEGCSWCDACADSKSLEWESEMIQLYLHDKSLRPGDKRATDYHLLTSPDPSTSVIRCSERGHAERYDNGQSIPFFLWLSMKGRRHWRGGELGEPQQGKLALEYLAGGL